MSQRLNIIRQYLAAVTDRNDIVVVNEPHGASTHVNQRVVRIDAGVPYALDLAAHEGEHLNQTESDAFATMVGSVRFVANALEDARMEVAAFRKRPGLRELMERGVIAASLPLVYEADNWIVQAIKAFYLESAGWEYDRSRLRPKARRYVTKFIDLG